MPHDLPRMTVFAIAMTSGLLLALAGHILSARLDIGLTSIWQELFPTEADATRSALGWWLIAGFGFAGSFLAGLLAQDVSAGLRPRRRLRRLIATLFFLLLAGVPYLATAAPAANLPFALGGNLAVFALGTVTSFCGSWFALPK